MNNSNSIEKKWDTNWCKRYWKFACDHDVEQKKIWKDTFPFFFTWESTKQILIWNCPKENLLELFKQWFIGIVQRTIYWNCSNNDLWNIKLSYLNQFWQIVVIEISWFFGEKTHFTLKNTLSKNILNFLCKIAKNCHPKKITYYYCIHICIQ
jgi:hypothetical protein